MEEVAASSDRRHSGPRRVPLSTLADLVRTVALDVDPRLEVVGVTNTEGGEAYAEVVIRLMDCDGEPCRLTVGIDRLLDRGALALSLGEQLREYLVRAS
jgi:hypothetical protein